MAAIVNGIRELWDTSGTVPQPVVKWLQDSRELERDNHLAALDASLPEPPSKEEAAKIAETYLVRVPHWGDRLVGEGVADAYGDQLTFGLEMHRSIQMGEKLLSQKNRSFDDLMRLFAYRRGVIAKQAKAADSWYGKMRTCQHSTPVRKRYEEIAWRMIRGELNHIPKTKTAIKLSSEIHRERRTIYADIEGENLPLSSFLLVTGEPALLEKECNLFTVPTPGIPNTRVVVIHEFPAEKIPKGMKIVKALFEKTLDQSTSNEEAYLLLAKIYWWICHIKPWKGGDPSIAEMLIRSIALYRKIELGPRKQGLISWVEVVCEATPDAFAAKFAQCFEPTPSVNPNRKISPS